MEKATQSSAAHPAANTARACLKHVPEAGSVFIRKLLGNMSNPSVFINSLLQ